MTFKQILYASSFFLIINSLSFCASMKEKLLSTSDFSSIKGSYAVFESQKNITLLRVMEIAHPFLLLEEISVPFEVAKKRSPLLGNGLKKKDLSTQAGLFIKLI